MDEYNSTRKPSLLANLALYENDTKVYDEVIRKALKDTRELSKKPLLPGLICEKAMRIDFSGYRPVQGGPEQRIMLTIKNTHDSLGKAVCERFELHPDNTPHLTETITTKFYRLEETEEHPIGRVVRHVHALHEKANKYAIRLDGISRTAGLGQQKTYTSLRQLEPGAHTGLSGSDLLKSISGAANSVLVAGAIAAIGIKVARVFLPQVR